MAERLPREERSYIAQGEQAIGTRDTQVISTILGSCVALCLWDDVRRIGGMNHILIPDGHLGDVAILGAGATSIERLINALMRCGADRNRLQSKVFGGASIVAGLSDVGERNVRFVFNYLRTEGIPCRASSVGGTLARQIRFRPTDGLVRHRLVRPDDAPELRPQSPSLGHSLELL